MADLIWIGVVLRAAKSVEGMRVRPDLVEEVSTLHHLGLVDETVPIADANHPPPGSSAALPRCPLTLIYVYRH